MCVFVYECTIIPVRLVDQFSCILSYFGLAQVVKAVVLHIVDMSSMEVASYSVKNLQEVSQAWCVHGHGGKWWNFFNGM